LPEVVEEEEEAQILVAIQDLQVEEQVEQEQS